MANIRFPVAGPSSAASEGPDQRVGDIAVIKTTPLTERVQLIFRWEVFNVLNRPNFANPSNDVSTPSTFGVISALTVNPRIMQYAPKLERCAGPGMSKCGVWSWPLHAYPCLYK